MLGKIRKIFKKEEPEERLDAEFVAALIEQDDRTLYEKHKHDIDRRIELRAPLELKKLIRQNTQLKDPAQFIQNRDELTPAFDSAIRSISTQFKLGDTRIPDLLFSWFVRHGFIGAQACAFLAQHWLIKRACHLPAKDAMKNGYDLAVPDGEKLDPKVKAEIERLDTEKYDTAQECVDFVGFSREFGFRIAYCKVKSKDKMFYEKPFNPDGILPDSYEGIVQIDPQWITPELDYDSVGDPASVDFYEPTYWRVHGKRYHKSHLILIRHEKVADILKPSYWYGGIPLPQQIYERVYAAERSANEVPMLLLTKRLFVIKTNVRQVIANATEFFKRLNIFADFKDNHGIYAIDEDENFDQHDTNLTHVRDVIEQQYDIVAAIAGPIPATKLYGRHITGLSNENGGDKRNYYDLLETLQKTQMCPLLSRHYMCMMRSDIWPKFSNDLEVKAVFRPLESPTTKERAEINEIKARTAKTYSEAGAIDGNDIRMSLINDEYSGFNDLEEKDIVEELDDRMNGLMQEKPNEKNQTDQK